MIEIASRIWKQMRSDVMITLEQCTASAGLAPNEIVLGSTPSAKHRSLLASYLLNLKRGPEGVRDMMVDLGVVQQAADSLIVLRQYLSDYPEARLMRHSGGQRDLSALTPIRH
jgi:hypothetical protein